MTRFQLPALFLCSFVVGATACGTSTTDGSDVDTSDRDPRCVAACPETMPQYAGVGAVCDSASRGECLDQCEARIAGLPTLCQSCLLEDACFSPGGCFGTDSGGSCDESTCTLTSEFGSCSYPTDDQAGRVDCLKVVDPRREVACAPDFQSTTKCASVCP